MVIEIKKAHCSDAEDIYNITREAFKKYADELGLHNKVSALEETIDTIKAELNTKTIFIGTLNGIPSGSIRYEILPGGIVYISRFGVKPNVHNCGLGKALIQAVEEDAKKLQAKYITLHTASTMTSLVLFYYKMGFYIHSTTTDRGYIRALFCKDLSPNGIPDLSCVNIK